MLHPLQSCDPRTTVVNQVALEIKVPMRLRTLLDMAQLGGAFSLERSVGLCISNSHPLPLTLDQ